MVQVSELRIGNLLEGMPPERDAAFPFNEGIGRITAFGIQLVEKGMYAPRPVPLTAEWLERFGFEKAALPKVGTWMRQVNPRYCFSVVDFGIGWRLEPFWSSANIEFVHQLQNLYFALTGGELTIKETA